MMKTKMQMACNSSSLKIQQGKWNLKKENGRKLEKESLKEPLENRMKVIQRNIG